MDSLPVFNGPHNECRLSQEFPDEDGSSQQTTSDELFWYDAHFGVTERMVQSLQLGGSAPEYDLSSPQHHSLDDMSRNGLRHEAKDVAANHKSGCRDDDDDDDDDDIDMETMKNKFLSAWTNAKNGR